jgi:peptidoglycan/LPS O-acetylase OafA/YrhL
VYINEDRNETLLRNFFIRRIFRIAPLYYCGILLYFVSRSVTCKLIGDASEIQSYSILGIIKNIIFVHSLDFRNFNFVVPGGWSIGNEDFFYLLFPFLFKIQRHYTTNKVFILILIITLICGLCELTLIYKIQPHLIKLNIINNTYYNNEWGFIYCIPINQLPVFLLGILAYRYIRDGIRFFSFIN